MAAHRLRALQLKVKNQSFLNKFGVHKLLEQADDMSSHPRLSPGVLEAFRAFLRDPSRNPPRVFAEECEDKEQDMIVEVLARPSYRQKLTAFNDAQLASTLIRFRRRARVPDSPFDRLRRQLGEAVDRSLDTWPPRYCADSPETVVDSSGRISSELVAAAMVSLCLDDNVMRDRRAARAVFVQHLWTRYFSYRTAPVDHLSNSVAYADGTNTGASNHGFDGSYLTMLLRNQLTDNQLQLLLEIARGKQRNEIMADLALSSATYDRHFKSLIVRMRQFARETEQSSHVELRAIMKATAGIEADVAELSGEHTVDEIVTVERRQVRSLDDEGPNLERLVRLKLRTENQVLELLKAVFAVGSVI